ncbi:MAG: hypothetical protein AAFZ49_14330, partial [Cyanobacteria bacterium J06659_2]
VPINGVYQQCATASRAEERLWNIVFNQFAHDAPRDRLQIMASCHPKMYEPQGTCVSPGQSVAAKRKVYSAMDAIS